SNFIRLGQKLNTYVNDNPLLYNSALKIYQGSEPSGEIDYSRGTVLKNFLYIEPRAALAYQNKPSQSFKASYNRMVQYLHL